jgi:restriction endonuclease S subunit
MIESLVERPKYEIYKNSGLKWLGKIPNHWELSRLKNVVFINPMVRYPKEKFGFSVCFLPMESVESNGSVHYRIKKRATNALNGFTNFVRNDLIFAKITPCFENGKGACLDQMPTKFGFGSTEFHVLRKRSNSIPKFIYFITKTHLFSELGKALMVGSAGQKRVPTGFISNFPIALPTREEQIAIASFLDRKTAQIDRAVAIKEKQIALLRERKQILIQNAVTRGLDPDVPMRDSGVEWIGEIPGHWEVTKVGRLADVSNGSTPSRDVERYWKNGTIPWISSGKVNEFRIKTPSEWITENALRECSIKICPKGTVLVGIVGQGKTRGTSALLEISAAINQNAAAIIPQKKLDSKYLHYFFIQAYEEVRNYGKGSNQAALNCEIVSSVKILLPPLEEQTAIVAHIETQSQKIDHAIALQQQQIEKLKEYKATLINSAVTGKIRVPMDSEAEALSEASDKEATKVP